MANKQNFDMFKGEDVTLTINMNPSDVITGWGITFSVKQKITDTAYGIQKTIANGGVIILSPSQFVVNLLAADTNVLNDGIYVWDAKRTDAGSQGIIAFGNLILKPTVTA